MISYAIRLAQSSGLFKRIVVSTDSHKISKIAKKYGAEVPFLRPKKYSDDFSNFNESIIHAIKWFNNKKIIFNNTCCIYPTSPLINYKKIIKGFKLLKKTKSYVFSGCAYRSSPQRSFFFKSLPTKENLRL